MDKLNKPNQDKHLTFLSISNSEPTYLFTTEQYKASPSTLDNRSLSSDDSKIMPIRSVPSSSSLASTLSASRYSMNNKSLNKRHSMYHFKAAPEEKFQGIIKDIEKLRLDLPRLSFETDSDSDIQSLQDQSFTVDDLTDVSSVATSEIRRSTDSLTPSEHEMLKNEVKAEANCQKAMNNEKSSSSSSLKGKSSPLVTSPPITALQLNGPPNVKPIPPNEMQDPKEYLHYLENTFNRNQLGSLLSKKDEFHSKVLDTFMEDLDFKDQSIDMALRNLLSVLHLPKEAQQIDRIISVFSKRYYEVNKELFASPDLVYTLSFSLLLLHTDAHNKLVKHKMSKEEYIKQTRQLDNGSTVPREVLEILYDNVTNVEFFIDDDDTRSVRSLNISGKSGKRSWLKKIHDSNKLNWSKGSQVIVNQVHAAVKVASILGSIVPERSPYTYRSSQNVFSDALIKNPFKIKVRGIQPHFQHKVKARPVSGFSIQYLDESADISELQCLKEGLLLRKSDLNEAGHKTHLRSWREFWVVLAGSQLVLFKEVSTMRTRSEHLDSTSPAPQPYSITSVANSIVVLDREYTKHPHVFRFVTSDGRQYLFRCESKGDMTEWMTKINFTAAFKSANVLPRGVSSKAFNMWKKSLPQLDSFDFEDNNDEELRSKVIKENVSLLDKQIQNIQERIDGDLLLLKQMGIMVAFTKSTKERAKGAGHNIQFRLKSYYLELQKAQCYKEILERDLSLSPSNTMIDRE
ncbi:hypothetical protein K502DRAFT_323279 [Neoconidiobolus thromboides FSU 785]|nr:hypothetical protein K502DRAFT_323279 [Neoconidiobolus thromboides FSU 785]